MALRNDFFVKCVDFCNRRVNLYTTYRDLVFADYDRKKESRKQSAFDKLELKKAPLRLSLISEEEARAEVVDKAVAKYAKKLRMKYRVVREDVKRKKAKLLKADENADLTELDNLLEQTAKHHEELVAERKAVLDKEFDQHWANRNIDEEQVRADLEAMEEENKALYELKVEKIDKFFEKRRNLYGKITELRIKFWQGLEKAIVKIGEEKTEDAKLPLEISGDLDIIESEDVEDTTLNVVEEPVVEEQAGAETQVAEEKKSKKVKKVIEPLPDDVILRATNLSMHFGGLKAVDELDFDVKKGEVFGLIGPNGAGKTTVFNCITQFYKPTKGDLHFMTKEGRTISLTDYKVHNVILKGIARTFQNVEVVKEVTVLENMLIAATRQYSSTLLEQMFHFPILRREEKLLRAKADRILAYMGLSLYRDRLAWGLPYGVLKRIEIARVLMCDPQLIILDEPAAGLNDTETKELADLIRKIRDDFDCTVLLVEHDMGLVMDVCDHICAISFGRKLAYGTPEEVQASKEVQEAYLGTGGDN